MHSTRNAWVVILLGALGLIIGAAMLLLTYLGRPDSGEEARLWVVFTAQYTPLVLVIGAAALMGGYEELRYAKKLEADLRWDRRSSEEWASDADLHHALGSLHRSEIEAVARALARELDLHGRRTFRRDLAQNFLFFALGLGVALVVR